MKRTNGFTLIELLTVIAVLAILLAIVGTSYPGITSAARRIICASRLHNLSTLIRLTRERMADEEEHTLKYSDFLHTLQWPDRVYETGEQQVALFTCPEDTEAARPEIPNILYRSGINKSVFVPFDGNQFLCVSRQGVDENDEPYTEYCVEENPGVKAEWEYAMGVKEYSTNDGIWRVYDKGVAGKRRMELVWYDCGWPNELWVDGECYATDMWKLYNPRMTIYFNDFPTSYGYNTQLQGARGVASDTIVLLDYKKRALADPYEFEMTDYLDGSARHGGKHNVLFAHGGVELRDTLDLYPEVNGAPWTPKADEMGRSFFERDSE